MILASLGFKKALHQIGDNYYLYRLNESNKIETKKINKYKTIDEILDILEHQGFVNLLLASQIVDKDIIKSFYVDKNSWIKLN